jgi:hypothetical protein
MKTIGSSETIYRAIMGPLGMNQGPKEGGNNRE